MKTCADIESLVTPYVDGEADREGRVAVEAHLAVCSPCRARAAAEKTARQIVRARADLLAERAPASLRARCSRLTASPDEPIPGAARGLLAGLRMARMPGMPRMPRMRRWVPLSLAASLVLAVGAIYGMTNRLEAAFVAQLTVDHTKCFIETKPGSRIDAHEAETRLVSLYGWDIPVPPGSSAEQIELVDVRRCMYADGYMAHLLYEHQGRAISLFVLPDTARRERLLEIMGHDALIWSEAGRAYVLLGQEGPEGMDEIAAYVRRATSE